MIRPLQACLLFALAPVAAPAATWQTGDPVQHAREPARLAAAVERIGEMPGVQGVLVAHRGELVAERYFRGGRADQPHNMKSASKSVLSALTGIAIEEGLLGLDQPIAELLRDSRALSDPAKRAITVRHLLTMTSGLEPTSYDTYNEWIRSHDWVESALARPLVAEPGTFYQYSTGTTHILSAVIAAAAGTSTREYAESRLFSPLGIQVMGWQQDPAGTYVGGNNLSLLPRGMLRFGQLYLDRGRYGDRQVLPAAWVEESTRTGQSGLHVVYGTYRYLWWTDLYYRGAFSAVGYGGQYVYVSPPHDAVVVITSTLESKGLEWTRRLFAQLRDGVLAAFEPSASHYARLGRTASDPALDSLAQSLDATEEQLSRLRQELRAGPPSASRGRTTSRVNLREAPETAARRLTVLERGAAFEVLGRSEAWLEVRTDRERGWLHGDYVRLDEETTWRAALAPLGAELASFVSAARRALRDGQEVPGVADPAGDDQVPLRLDGPDPVFAAEEGEVARLSGRAGEFASRPAAGRDPVDTAAPGNPRSEALERQHAATLEALDEAQQRVAQLEARLLAEAEASRRGAAELDGVRAEGRRTLQAAEQRIGELEQRLVAEAESARRRGEELAAGQAEALGQLDEARRRIADLEEAAASDAAAAQSRLDAMRGSVTQAEEQAAAAEVRTARAQSAALAAAGDRDRLASEIEAQRQAGAEKLEALETEVRGLREERARLAAELETSRRQVTELSASVAERDAAIASAGDERRRLDADLAAARERLSGELTERQIESAELEALAGERDRLTTELDTARQERVADQQEIERLRREKEEAAAGFEAQIETVRGQAAALATELTEAERGRESVESERQRLAAELAATRDRMNTEVRGERARAAETEEKLTASEASSTQLRAERDRLERELAQARREREATAAELAAAGRTGERRAAEIEELTGDLARERLASSEAREALESTRGELDSTRAALAGAEAGLAALESSGDTASRRLSEIAGQLESVRSELASTRLELEAAREEGRRLAAELEGERRRRTDSLAAAQSDADGIAAELASTRAALEESRRALQAEQQTRGDADALAAELASTRAALEESRRALQAEQQARDSASQASVGLQQSLEERERLAREAETRLGEMQGRLAAAERRAADQATTVADHVTRITALERALEEARAAFSEIAAERARWSEELATVRRERDAAASELAAAAPPAAPVPEDRIAGLEEALRRSEELSRQQARELDGLRSELLAQGRDLADAAAERARLSEELAAERSEKGELAARIEELERAPTAPRPRPGASGPPGGRDSVAAFVRSWAEALSRRDLERFAAHYAAGFQPPSGLGLGEWTRRRIAEIGAPTVRGLELGTIEVAGESGVGASARFVYRLVTSERPISLTKTLDLVWEGGGWKIVREVPLLR